MRFAYLAALGCCLTSFTALYAEANETIGSFRFIESKDGITDQDTSFIITYSPGEDVSLIWRCRDKEQDVVVDTGQYMVGDNYEGVNVRYRVDKSPPSPVQTWGLASGNDAVFVPDAEVSKFTRQALSGSTVAIDIIDLFDGARSQHKFNLSGLGEAIKNLSCFKSLAR